MGAVGRLYCAFQTFFGLLIWLPIFYEYQRRVGLDDAQIFAIQTLYNLLAVFLELPAGWAADRFGRRKLMRVAAGMLLVANALPLLWVSFTGFLTHFLLVGTARSLVSSAASAYLYDHLAQRGDSHRYRDIEGTARSLSLGAKIAVWPAAGWLMNVALPLPYAATMVAAALALVAATQLPAPVATPAATTRSVGHDVGAVLGILRSTPLLVLIMLQGLGIFVIQRVVQVSLLQPLLATKDFAPTDYGWVLSVTTIFEAVGAARSGALRGRINDLTTLLVLTLLFAAMLSAVALAGSLGTVVLLSVFSLAAGLAFPLRRQLMNDTIVDSRYRATLLSVEAIVDRGAAAAVTAIAGVFVARGDIPELLHWCAGITIATALPLYVITRARVTGAETRAQGPGRL